MIGAVIYIRVSMKEQTENLSLPTQLTACEDYCQSNGYTVLERFADRGESAKTADRTELKNLLQYCRAHKGRVHFVIVYNLTRFAREKYDHFALRSHLKSLGISLRSVTEPIDDASTGKLMEGVLAAFAQFDNDVRADRTRAGMTAALSRGRWTFRAPLGYLSAPKWTGKSLVPDPERGPLVQHAFEEFASGYFSMREVLADATRRGLRARHGGPLGPQLFGTILRNPVYIGILNVRGYGVRDARADFEPLISEDVFYRVQAILTGRMEAAVPHQRRRPDFPLRGFVRCAACSRPLTASRSKGRSDYYACYHCRGGVCRAVNTGKTELEGLFADELKWLQPSPDYMRMLKDVIIKDWRARKDAVEREQADLARQAVLLKQRINRLDEAFLFEKTIDIDTYDRHKDRISEQQTFLKIDHYASELEQLDAEGIRRSRSAFCRARRTCGCRRRSINASASNSFSSPRV
jgi:DNA invertase Pin-like site-specific DNA recombinase